MIVKSRLNGSFRKPKNAAQRKALSHRDWLRRQQDERIGFLPVPPEDQVAPTNTTQPSFAPPPSNGNESGVDDGEWDSSTPTTFEYQWQLDGVDIVGATFKTILVLVGMVGKTLRCAVKCVNLYGFTVALTVGIMVTI